MQLLKKIFNSEIKAINKEERTLTAYVSTAARDRMDEVLSSEGVDLKMFKKNPVVLFAHNYRQPPIAKALWIKRDQDGVLSKMQFANTEFADEIFKLYSDGFMKAFSVGFIPRETEDGDGKKKPRRTYKKWELLEYSAVPVPANPEALALAIQKGILKNEDLKKQLGEGDITDPGKNQKAATEPPKKTEPPKLEKANPELLTEIALLKKDLADAQDIILDLRYKLTQKSEKKEQMLSEMTDGSILKKIEEIAVGVIRKITGKVN